MVPWVATEKKSPVTPPGIDPGTSRLVAQCLSHYAIPGPDGYIFIHKKEQSKSKGFSNHWKCTIFSQLPSDLLFHISSFPPYDDLYCIAVVKFQFFSFREIVWKSYSACVQRKLLQKDFLPVNTIELNIQGNFRNFRSFHLSTGNTDDRRCLNYAAQNLLCRISSVLVNSFMQQVTK